MSLLSNDLVCLLQYKSLHHKYFPQRLYLISQLLVGINPFKPYHKHFPVHNIESGFYWVWVRLSGRLKQNGVVMSGSCLVWYRPLYDHPVSMGIISYSSTMLTVTFPSKASLYTQHTDITC